MVNSTSLFGQSHTPKVVLKLIIVIAVASLFSALWESLFTLFMGAPLLQSFFELSMWGISHLFIWQFITYLFIIDSHGAGITLFYLISVLFNSYILWIMGTAICEYGGRKQFLQLFFLSGLAAGIVGILFQWIFGYNIPFSGPDPSLLALFTVWTILNPEAEILLFFVIPLRIKWLFAGVVGAILLINIAQLNIVYLLFYMTGIASGYVFATSLWELRSPFSFTTGIDDRLIAFGDRVRKKRSKASEQSGSKIVRLFAGNADLDDDAFIDAMLNKISEKGTDSLTWAEKKRMDEIAKSRQK